MSTRGHQQLRIPYGYCQGYILPICSRLLLDFSLSVKAATVCGSAISSAKEGKLGFTYNLVKS